MEGLAERMKAELSREVASLLKRWLQRYKQVGPTCSFHMTTGSTANRLNESAGRQVQRCHLGKPRQALAGCQIWLLNESALSKSTSKLRRRLRHDARHDTHN
jgi:hypothetical protein